MNTTFDEKMIEVGAHLGHKNSMTNPKMKSYLLGPKNNIQIIDLVKTEEKLNSAIEFLKNILDSQGVILFVGTRPAAKEEVAEIAQKLSMPYVNERWLGGTLTNFATLQKRIEYFLNLEKMKASGELTKYTKKEQIMFEKKLKDLEKKFNGIKTLKKLPDAIFIINTKHHETTVREAKITKTPIVGVLSSQSDPTFINYPIPAADDSRLTIKYILDKIYAKNNNKTN